MSRVSVLLVSYRTRELLLRCLDSLYTTTGGAELEIVVVDNRSDDGSVIAARTQFPDAIVIELAENVGFARAVNIAAAQATGEYLLLLNPDTVVHPGAVDALVGLAQACPEAGIYGGRTLRPDGSLDPSSCVGAPSLWSLACFAAGLSTLLPGSRAFDPASPGRRTPDVTRRVDVVTGCLMLVDRRLWERLGGFDPRFFMYSEDVDLCVRAARLGRRPMVTPAAAVTHHVGASSRTSGDRRVLVMKGRATVVRKHWSRPVAALGLALLAAGCGVRAAVARWSRRGEAAAWGDAWRRRSEWLPGYQPAGEVPLEDPTESTRKTA